MIFKIAGRGAIYRVLADGIEVGHISRPRDTWEFYYTAEWRNPPREQEAELWQMINSKLAILNVTSRLTK